jgi:hypothetical protein
VVLHDGVSRAGAARAGLGQLRDCTTVALALLTLASVGAGVLTTVAYNDLAAGRRPHSTPMRLANAAAFTDHMRFARDVDVAVLVLIALSGALFLPWMGRARQIVADLHADGLTHGDAWVTLGWFPFANLVVPYVLACDLWGGVERRARRPRSLLLLWWLPTAAVSLVFDIRLLGIGGDITRLLVPHPVGATIGTMIGTTGADVALLATLAVSALGAIVLVRRTTAHLAAGIADAEHKQTGPGTPQRFATAAASHVPS